MRKSTLMLMIVIFGLMFYTGCGEDDDGGMMGEPPPGGPVPNGGGVPPMACENCPCKYFDVPMTEECWVVQPRFSVNTGGGTLACLLRTRALGGTELFLELPGPASPPQAQFGCQIRIDNDTPDCGKPINHVFTEQDFIDDVHAFCRVCYDGYLNDLNQVLPIQFDDRQGLTCSIDVPPLPPN